jgi:hypothetical protein
MKVLDSVKWKELTQTLTQDDIVHCVPRAIDG